VAKVASDIQLFHWFAGQLLYGPFWIVLEGKPVYGLLVYILASLGCAFVTDIDTFIGFDSYKPWAGCAATVAAIAMVRICCREIQKSTFFIDGQ
jgi:DHA1 family bicyclomycin/chloramphenicol resistance-like MFS transporter